MDKKITWNKKGLKSLAKLLAFIKESAPGYEHRFVSLIYERIALISKYPEYGRLSKNKKTIRELRIDKNSKMYYRNHGNTIFIVYFFDMRQHPDKNKV